MMRHAFTTCLGGIVLLVAKSVLAEPIGAYDDKVLRCVEDHGSQVSIGQCIAGVLEESERDLAEAYNRAMAEAQSWSAVAGVNDPDFTTLLRQTQEAWQTYTEQHCALVAAFWAGGSGQGNSVSSCHIDANWRRMRALEELG